VSYLLEAVQRIQQKEDFSKVLSEDTLEDIQCATITLSAAVMQCLATAIELVKPKGRPFISF
jgi:hypothetical protein